MENNAKHLSNISPRKFRHSVKNSKIVSGTIIDS